MCRLGSAETIQQKTENNSNWLLHGHSYNDQRDSPLEEITVNNVDKPGLQWYIDLPRDGGQEATPLIIGSMMYFSTAWSGVYAVHAGTGKVDWIYDPEVPRRVLGHACCGPVNGGAEFGVRGYVTAYDTESGEKVWRFYTVPGNPAEPFENEILKKAALTWYGEWWKFGGWDCI